MTRSEKIIADIEMLREDIEGINYVIDEKLEELANLLYSNQR